MAKAKAKGANKGTLGSVALGTTPRGKRSDKRTQAGAKPRKKQSTAHLREYEFQVYGWAVFAKGTNNPHELTTEQLKQVVKRASKAANQRLRKLEKAGINKWAYKAAQKQLGNRKRYWERTDKKSRAELISEYARLRDFMTAQTSTMSGIRKYHEEQTSRARQMGFTGTDEELAYMYEKFMDEAFANLLGSEIIQKLILQNRRDILEDLYRQWQEDLKAEQHNPQLGGALLIEAVKRMQE